MVTSAGGFAPMSYEAYDPRGTALRPVPQPRSSAHPLPARRSSPPQTPPGRRLEPTARTLPQCEACFSQSPREGSCSKT